MAYIPDNQDTFSWHEAEQEQDEPRIELINSIISDIDNVISDLDEYDTEDNKDLVNRIEKGIEGLRELIGKLEGER